MLQFYFFTNIAMKRLLKKVPLRKKEAERTKREKRARDIAFFGVVALTLIMGALTINAEAGALEAEAGNIMSIDCLK